MSHLAERKRCGGRQGHAERKRFVSLHQRRRLLRAPVSRGIAVIRQIRLHPRNVAFQTLNAGPLNTLQPFCYWVARLLPGGVKKPDQKAANHTRTLLERLVPDVSGGRTNPGESLSQVLREAQQADQLRAVRGGCDSM